MFRKTDIDALLTQLKGDLGDRPEYEELLRDAHLGIAYSDAGRPLGDDIDPRVASLIEKHRPQS